MQCHISVHDALLQALMDGVGSTHDKLMGLEAIDSRSGLFWIQNCTLIKKLANINLTLVETSHSFPSPGIIILIESLNNWLKGMSCFLKEILWNILNLWQICKDVFPMVGGTQWSIWKIQPLIFYNSPLNHNKQISEEYKKRLCRMKREDFHSFFLQGRLSNIHKCSKS